MLERKHWMLAVTNADVFRGETQILWNISMEVQQGEKVAILGSNGAGKSTLLAAIVGVLPIAKGAVTFNGETLQGKRSYQIVKMGLALVPEGRRIYGDMSVWENLEMGAYPKRGRAHLVETMVHVLALFPILGKRKHQRAGTLSGGEQQMLAIGRAMMGRPEMLLIDELSLGLAPVVTQEIYQVLDGLTEETTILMVEQNVDQALKHSHRAYVLESGRMTQSGLSKDLVEDKDIRRAYLGM
jgi:branched-chain amino acid transport system ATP-binding protein